MMNKIFSADDIEHFWSPSPPSAGPLPVHEPSVRELPATNSSSSSAISRSPSEWAFQRFLQEASEDIHHNPNTCFPSESPISSTTASAPAILNDVDEIKDYEPHANYDDDHNHHTDGGQNKSSRQGRGSFGEGVTYPPMDSDEYQAFLKSRLHLACAAVALNSANSTKPMECSVGVAPGNGLRISNTSQMGSKAAALISKRQDKDGSNPLGGISLPAVQRLPMIPVRSATSGSSREDSDDDEVEGETEMTQNMDPADTKRMRRMLSNRESARRSRRRKQAHISDIETQVSQLRVENSSFLKRFADISQKYNEAAVDNRVLKADVETLRAKVKMAEETVKRVTGLSPFFQAMSEISTISMPSFAGSPSDISIEDQKQHLHHSPVTSHLHAHEPQRINSASLDMHSVNGMYQSIATAAGGGGGGGGDKLGRTTSMQRVDSLEHLQKCIRGEFGS